MINLNNPNIFLSNSNYDNSNSIKKEKKYSILNNSFLSTKKIKKDESISLY